MSNIDDLFKKGLDGKGLEYSNGHWAGMEQLLSSKKVGFFARYKWAIGTSVFLIVSSVCIYLSTSNSSVTETATTPIAATEVRSELIHTGDNIENTVSTKVLDSHPSDSEGNVNSPSNVVEQVVPELKVVSLNPGITSEKADPTPQELVSDNPISYPPSPSEGERRGIELGTANNVTLNVSDAVISPEETKIKPDFGEVIKSDFMVLKSFPWSVGTKADGLKAFLPMYKAPKWSMYVSTYGGFVNYAKDFNTPNEYSDEFNNLGKSETQNSINYGINFGVQHKKIRISTGLGMLSLREKTFYTESSFEYVFTTAPRITNTKYTTTPRGTRVVLIGQVKADSTEVSTSNYICNGCDVEFNYITVPINVQYTIGKRRLRYFGDVGLNTSFFKDAKGDYAQVVGEQNSQIEVVNLSSTSDVSKILLHANASIGTQYWISPRCNIWSSFGYGLGLNSMFESYEQKATLRNLKVGLEYKLR
ncbi:MAG: hypothetical protein COA58_14835 [Bacteroidetes bacterium]|nr:MAG: hypothetical protein COA58_14835 [Bacteroidota bacterium]